MPFLLEPGRNLGRETAPSKPEKQQKKIKLDLPHSSKSNLFSKKTQIETADMDLEDSKHAETQADDNIRKENNENYKNDSINKKRSPLQYSRKEPETTNLTYKLKESNEEYPIMEANDKKICPFCKASVKNIKIHFDRAKICGEKIDIDHFSQLHNAILLEKRRHQIRRSVQQHREKLRAEDPEKFNEDKAKAKQNKRNENPQKFDEKNRKAAAKSKQKARNENPKKFVENYREASAKSKQKSKNENPEKFDEDHRKAQGKYWGKKKANIDETERLRRFNLKILFGPIFICSCCKRKLYENGVTKITDDFKQAINSKKPFFFIDIAFQKKKR